MRYFKEPIFKNFKTKTDVFDFIKKEDIYKYEIIEIGLKKEFVLVYDSK